MIEFLDKTQEQNGTPLNRKNMMALQGFEAISTVISEDGKTIIETNAQGQTLTTIIEESEITEQFVGEKTITKKTTHSNKGYSEAVY